MWISNKLLKANATALHGARVINSNKNSVSAVGSREFTNAQVITPCGIYCTPVSGDKAVMVTVQGKEYCIGTTKAAQGNLLPGEIMLCSAGGASIVLKNDGSVLINGKAV